MHIKTSLQDSVFDSDYIVEGITKMVFYKNYKYFLGNRTICQ